MHDAELVAPLGSAWPKGPGAQQASVLGPLPKIWQSLGLAEL